MTVPNEASTPQRRPWAIAVAILVAVPLAAGVVQAAIPDTTTGEITVCYRSHTGEMRLIDKQSVPACSSDETPLSWNQKGPPGPTGTQGAQGTPGLSGLRVRTGRTPATGGDSTSPKEAIATCDPGLAVIGTAVNIDSDGPNPIHGGGVAVDEVIPITGNTEVRAVAFAIPSAAITPNRSWALRAYAFCARVQ